LADQQASRAKAIGFSRKQWQFNCDDKNVASHDVPARKAVGQIMANQPGTPFENIEGALEYVGYLLEASREAQEHIEAEIAKASGRELDRKKQALQIVKYKLTLLEMHIGTSMRLLKDLRKLRRLMLETGETRVRSVTA
jgi:hypothetical protein